MVKRGLERKQEIKSENIGIDETPFKKRHDYVTMVDEEGGSENMIFRHDAEELKGWFMGHKNCDFSELLSITVDMRIYSGGAGEHGGMGAIDRL
jgi:hypothetical protein